MDLAYRDEHPSFSVEALTLAGLIQQNLRNAWLILNQSESIWDGNVRARGNRGSSPKATGEPEDKEITSFTCQ